VVFIDGLKRVIQNEEGRTLHLGPDRRTEDVMVVSDRPSYDFAGRVVEQRYPVTEPLGTPGNFNQTETALTPPGPNTTSSIE
jgi:hypothetical protein